MMYAKIPWGHDLVICWSSDSLMWCYDAPILSVYHHLIPWCYDVTIFWDYFCLASWSYNITTLWFHGIPTLSMQVWIHHSLRCKLWSSFEGLTFLPQPQTSIRVEAARVTFLYHSGTQNKKLNFLILLRDHLSKRNAHQEIFYSSNFRNFNLN